MGYINLAAYVQRKINNIFWSIWFKAQTYINDIMCGARLLLNLLEKLQTLFEIFLK